MTDQRLEQFFAENDRLARGVGNLVSHQYGERVMSKSLSDLVQDRRELEDQTEAAEGVVDEDLDALWQENDEAIEDKIERWGHFLRERTADIKTIDEEIKRLQERKTARANELARRKAYLQFQMESLGLEKVDRPLITVALQNNPPSVDVIAPLEQLPPEFQRVVPERREVDKKALLAAHKAGDDLPFGVIVKQTRSLRIR